MYCIENYYHELILNIVFVLKGYAMCLLDYEYHILHPAFLVHSPGIKSTNPHAKRLKYVPAMNKLIKNVIMPEYKIIYGRNKNCTV